MKHVLKFLPIVSIVLSACQTTYTVNTIAVPAKSVTSEMLEIYPEKGNIVIDYGQPNQSEINLFVLTKNNGKGFNSIMDAANYLVKSGWQFIQAYSKPEKTHGVSYNSNGFYTEGTYYTPSHYVFSRLTPDVVASDDVTDEVSEAEYLNSLRIEAQKKKNVIDSYYVKHGISSLQKYKAFCEIYEYAMANWTENNYTLFDQCYQVMLQNPLAGETIQLRKALKNANSIEEKVELLLKEQ